MGKPVTPSKLIEDVQVVVHDAEALLKATAALTGEKIEEARARTAKSLHRAKARLGAVENKALKRARALAGEAEDFVQSHPRQVIGTAAGIGAAVGIGLLLGLLISRR